MKQQATKQHNTMTIPINSSNKKDRTNNPQDHQNMRRFWSKRSATLTLILYIAVLVSFGILQEYFQLRLTEAHTSTTTATQSGRKQNEENEGKDIPQNQESGVYFLKKLICDTNHQRRKYDDDDENGCTSESLQIDDITLEGLWNRIVQQYYSVGTIHRHHDGRQTKSKDDGSDGVEDKNNNQATSRRCTSSTSSSIDPDTAASAAFETKGQQEEQHDDRSQNQINKLDGPIIIGLDTCADFRRQAGNRAEIGVAGLFNSGTNALAINLQFNIGIPHHKSPRQTSIQTGADDHNNDDNFKLPVHSLGGIRRSVQWTKHNPPLERDGTYSLQCSKRRGGCTRHPINHAHVLPVVVVRDPFHWRQSMCTSPYQVSWKGNNQTTPYTDRRCPRFWYKSGMATTDHNDLDYGGYETRQHGDPDSNFTEADKNRSKDSMESKIGKDPIHVDYPAIQRKLDYDSLMDFWHEYHSMYYRSITKNVSVNPRHGYEYEYKNDTVKYPYFPGLMVRSEDMIFYFDEVIEAIRDCVGGYVKQTPYRPYQQYAKRHGNHHEEKKNNDATPMSKLNDSNPNDNDRTIDNGRDHFKSMGMRTTATTTKNRDTTSTTPTTSMATTTPSEFVLSTLLKVGNINRRTAGINSAEMEYSINVLSSSSAPSSSKHDIRQRQRYKDGLMNDIFGYTVPSSSS